MSHETISTVVFAMHISLNSYFEILLCALQMKHDHGASHLSRCCFSNVQNVFRRFLSEISLVEIIEEYAKTNLEVSTFSWLRTNFAPE